jgi:hypothetical protein
MGSPAFYIQLTAKESAAQNEREAEEEFGFHGSFQHVFWFLIGNIPIPRS